jgi:hypothetical protein
MNKQDFRSIQRIWIERKKVTYAENAARESEQKAIEDYKRESAEFRAKKQRLAEFIVNKVFTRDETIKFSGDFNVLNSRFQCTGELEGRYPIERTVSDVLTPTEFAHWLLTEDCIMDCFLNNTRSLEEKNKQSRSAAIGEQNLMISITTRSSIVGPCMVNLSVYFQCIDGRFCPKEWQ